MSRWTDTDSPKILLGLSQRDLNGLVNDSEPYLIDLGSLNVPGVSILMVYASSMADAESMPRLAWQYALAQGLPGSQNPMAAIALSPRDVAAILNGRAPYKQYRVEKVRKTLDVMVFRCQSIERMELQMQRFVSMGLRRTAY